MDGVGRAALGVLVALAACVPPATVPIDTRPHPGTGGDEHCLVVFLHGRGDSVTSFEDHGFIEDLRAAGVRADAVSVGSHLGYYVAETITERLHADVIEPARARGVRRFFFVGLSMGGLGSVAYAADHPGVVSGMALIAPFLGSRALATRIEAAGGLRRWDTPPNPSRYEEIWDWLAGYVRDQPRPALYLLFGRDDPGFIAHRVLTAATPGTRVFVTAGRHGWVWWRPLWRSFLARHAPSLCN